MEILGIIFFIGFIMGVYERIKLGNNDVMGFLKRVKPSKK